MKQSLTSEEYPSSLQNSSINKKQKPVEQLTAEQQEMVAEYLMSIESKGLKQLLAERDQLLGELHSINTHLNQMITQLYGDLEQSTQLINNNQYNHPEQYLQKLPLNKNNPKPQQTINQLHLSSIPNQKKQLKSIEKLTDRQLTSITDKNQKIIQSLQDELQDFQFMLTPDYFDQIQQEIIKSQTAKRQLQSEVTLFTKQLNKLTHSYDSETLAKLQKITYDTSLELTLLSKKLESKIQKLNQINAEQKQKQAKIQTLTTEEADLERLLQMYEDQQYEGEVTSRKKREGFEKLETKKQKLQKIITSYNTNHLKLYNKKLSDFRNIHERIQTLSEAIKQMDYNIVLIVKERKEFESQNKDILNSHKNVSSLVNQKRKASLRLNNISTQNVVPSISEKRVSGNDSGKIKNRLSLVRPLERKQTEQIIPSLQKQNPSQSRYHTNDIRRRVYTELQNTHYFSSMDKNDYIKTIQTLEEASNNRQINKAKIQQKITDRNSIPHTDTYIPTSDKLIQIEPALIRKQSKIHQKKFNLSNTPLSHNKKEPGEQKSFSFYQHQQNSVYAPSETNSQGSKGYFKTKTIHRKGVSHEIQKESEDEIQKRLIHLQNLLKKGQTQEIEPDQIECTKQQRIEEKNIQKSTDRGKNQMNSIYGRQRQIRVKSTQNNNSKSEYYKELCKKLGRDKLLIEEDEDITSLIYQGIGAKGSN